MMFKIQVELSIPQLTKIGVAIVDALQNINDRLDEVDATLTAELDQIAAALATAGGPTPDQVNAVAQRLMALRDRIANIVPDAPPAP